MTTANLAEARRNFAEADAVYQGLKAKARSIADRIQVAKAKQAAITNKLVTGTATEADTSEFGALSADLELLATMLTEAEAAAEAKNPEFERNLLSQVQALHQREQDKTKFDALAAVCLKLDAALCEAIGEAHAFGKRLGHMSLSQSWRPSDALHRAVTYGVPPGGIQ